MLENRLGIKFGEDSDWNEPEGKIDQEETDSGVVSESVKVDAEEGKVSKPIETHSIRRLRLMMHASATISVSVES